VLLHRRVPVDAEELEPEAGGRSACGDQGQRRGDGEEREHRGRAEQDQRAGAERTRRPPPQRQQAAGDQARALAGEDRAPRGRPSERLLGHERPEHEEAAEPRHVAERRAGDRRPEPRPRPELVPALAQLAQEARRLGLHAPADVHPREQRCAGEIRGGVERDRPAGADRGDEHAADRGAADVDGVQRQAEQRVRLLQARRAHGQRHDPLRRGEEERGRDPARDLEGCQLPELRTPGEEQRRGDELHRTGEQVRADHDHVPRQPVGPHAPDEHEHDLRRPPGGEHDPERRRRAIEIVEDREGERDRGDRAARERDGAAEEEEAELALAERLERPPHAASRSFVQ
jgi:hypothetical protein